MATSEVTNLLQYIVRGPDLAAVSEVPLVRPGDLDLLVAPTVVGLCATDIEILDGSMIYLKTAQAAYPITPGHEWVGRVVEVGGSVTDFQIGDTVVGETSIGCGRCEDCLAGNYQRCASRLETGIMGQQGALAELFVYPSASAHVVSPRIDHRDAVFTEPLAVSYRALQQLDAPAGSTVLVVGAGTIGCLTVALLSSHLGLDVAVVTRSQASRRRAIHFGARLPEEGESFLWIIEAAGSESAVADAISLLADGGRLVLTGLTGAEELPVPIDQVVVRELQIIGSLGSPNVWPEVLGLLAESKFSPSDLITHTFPLAQISEAVETVRAHDPRTAKVVVMPQGDTNE